MGARARPGTAAACVGIVAVWLSAMPLPAMAAPSDPALTVALDWHDVSQATIDRCGLAGLENLLLASLIEQGFAIVAANGQQEATLKLRTTDDGLAIAATHDGNVERRQITLGRACDGTVAIEIVRLAKDALHAVLSAPAVTPLAPLSPPTVAPIIIDTAPQRVRAPDAWRFGLAAGAVAIQTDSFAPTLRFEVARDLPALLTAAVVLGASAWHSQGLWIVEPTLGGQLRRRIPFGDGWQFAAGAGADFMLHVYKYRDAPVGAVTNGRVGIPLELTFPHVPLALGIVPYARFRPVRHRVFDQVAFDSGWFACDAVLKWVF